MLKAGSEGGSAQESWSGVRGRPGLGLPSPERSPSRRHGPVQGRNPCLVYSQAGISDSILGTCPGREGGKDWGREMVLHVLWGLWQMTDVADATEDKESCPP